MTTHDKDKIIAAAKEAGFYVCEEEGFLWLSETDDLKPLERFYAIAFEAGCQAEREACAKEAEYYVQHSTIATFIANDIRARSTK